MLPKIYKSNLESQTENWHINELSRLKRKTASLNKEYKSPYFEDVTSSNDYSDLDYLIRYKKGRTEDTIQ